MGAFLVTYPPIASSRCCLSLVCEDHLYPCLSPHRPVVRNPAFQRRDSNGSEHGRVAYLAHIGGMVFGALTARLFEERDRVVASKNAQAEPW